DLLAHVDGRAVVLERLLDRDDRAVDARTVAARRREQHPLRPDHRKIAQPLPGDGHARRLEGDPQRPVRNAAHALESTVAYLGAAGAKGPTESRQHPVA